MTINKEVFGHMQDKEVFLFTLQSEGLRVEVFEYGATLKSIQVKDSKDQWQDVILSLDTLEDYMNNDMFLGAICGRNANRIENGQFSLAGTVYTLSQNDGLHSLHSGPNGFNTRIFAGKIVDEKVEFSLFSPHMDQGFPGNMTVKVTYSITKDNGILIEYEASSDMDTICNLTNHAYFNLEREGTILNHLLTVAADYYTPLSPAIFPNGEIRAVAQSDFDFTTPRRLGECIGQPNSEVCGGYDHNFVLREGSNQPVATLEAPQTGIRMDVYTTSPGIQVYTGNFLNGQMKRGSEVVVQYGAVCLETQYFPNAFSYTHFPKPLLKAGETQINSTEYRFSI